MQDQYHVLGYYLLLLYKNRKVIRSMSDVHSYYSLFSETPGAAWLLISRLNELQIKDMTVTSWQFVQMTLQVEVQIYV
jgi:hypothetical protein